MTYATNKDDPKGVILCVDDNSQFCQILSDFFTDRGYDVIIALSAEEGYNILKGGKAGILLLDLRMEGMGGMGLLKRLGDEKIDVPALIVTAFPQDILNLETYGCRICGYFEKPVELKAVYEAIKEHIRRKP